MKHPHHSNHRPDGAPPDPDHALPPDPAAEAEAGAEPAEVRRLESEADLEIKKLIEERDALREKWMRAVAEADNFRKRTQREMAEARLHATTEAVRPFLTVLDGFERAAAHANGNAEEIKKGVELLHRQLMDAARKVGLEPVEAVGKPFDPHQHEAVEMVESDSAKPGTVVEEFQRGYRLRERLIRPAMVKVAK